MSSAGKSSPAPPRQSSSGTRRVGDEQPPAITFSPGDLIGRKYRLIRALSEGGMASVWVAHNEALDIRVALKFIRSDLRDPHLADRLLHEARAAARLGHPAIVRVTDFGKTQPGLPYIVMELLDGQDLRTLLEGAGRMDSVQAVRTLLPIVDALALAHDKGIVHRDLKPENIFLAQADGAIRPKLVDFGVAKFDRPNFKRLTEYGTALGSPGYMSPEQARGNDADARSDIWALCVVLYELITGELPFDGETYNALLRSVIEDEPVPIMAAAAGDAELWEILKRGLTKPLEERWQSMRQLGAALASWLLARGYTDDITERSLQAVWLQRRSSNPGDLLTTPQPSRPSLPSFDFPRRANLRSELQTGTFPAEPPSLPGVVSEPRHSRAPLFGVTLGAIVVIAGGIWLWNTEHKTTPASAPANSAVVTAQSSAIAATASAPEHTGPVGVPSGSVPAGAAASTAAAGTAASPHRARSQAHHGASHSRRPVQKLRHHYRAPAHRKAQPTATSDLSIKTTL